MSLWRSFLKPIVSKQFLLTVLFVAGAFLVGYNIELFFSLMDRALFSITDRLQRPSPTKPEAQKPVLEKPRTSSVKPATPTMETPALGEAVG